jgi:hypothetical protein
MKLGREGRQNEKPRVHSLVAHGCAGEDLMIEFTIWVIYMNFEWVNSDDRA